MPLLFLVLIWCIRLHISSRFAFCKSQNVFFSPLFLSSAGCQKLSSERRSGGEGVRLRHGQVSQPFTYFVVVVFTSLCHPGWLAFCQILNLVEWLCLFCQFVEICVGWPVHQFIGCQVPCEVVASGSLQLLQIQQQIRCLVLRWARFKGTSLS